jgi:hypothetical protein
MSHDVRPGASVAERPALRSLRWSDEPQSLWRLLDIDFSRPLTFALLAVAYIASRAPFVNIGYGTDPDAWRVALTGHWLWDNGEFYPSRLPGYPVHELATAAIVERGGYLATNSLTVLVSLIGVWFFSSIAAELRVPNRALAVAGFAFAPLLWINSMTTMDYMWALTFLLGSYYFIIVRKNWLAAIMLGLAVGSRPTSAVMLLPLTMFLWRSGERDEVRSFVAAALGVALIAYSPIIWQYGPGFFNYYGSEVDYLNVLRLLGKDCLGLIGAIAALLAAAVSLPRLARMPSDARHDRHVALWLLAIALTLIVFFSLPHEAAYLIPLYPFGLLLMAKYFYRAAFAAAVAAIIAAGFVDLTSPGDEITSETFTNAELGRGLVLSNRDTMIAQRDYARDLREFDAPPNSVVIAGFIYPQFAVRYRDTLAIGIIRKDEDAISQLSDRGKAVDLANNVTYVWLLEWDEFEKYRFAQSNFFYTEDGGRSSATLFGYRPGLFKAALIDLGRAPSGGSGAARTDR